jgi:hypothetical protein
MHVHNHQMPTSGRQLPRCSSSLQPDGYGRECFAAPPPAAVTCCCGCTLCVLCSLALMGTDYGSFLVEASRVLRPGGWLWVAEVRAP